jgi:DNA-binding SARP family transcriptional activator
VTVVQAGKARRLNPLHFRLLGCLEVVDQETSVAIGGIRSRATLGYLLLSHNSVVPASRLIKALWPGGPPATGRKMLHNAISHLRGVLGVTGMTAEAPVLLTHGPGYFLRVRPESLDMICFERQVEHARGDLASGRWEQAASGLRDALALWRGPALADLVEAGVNWAELISLENVKLAAVEDLVEAQLAMRQYAQVISKLEAQLEVLPLRERMTGQLMRALYHGGRQSDALALYQRTRAFLIEEFGLDPSPGLQHLERAILNHDLAPGAPAGRAVGHLAERAILAEPVPSRPAPSALDPVVPARAAPVAVAGGEIKQISLVLIRALEEPAEMLDPVPFALAHEHITRAIEVEAARWGGMMVGMLGSLWMVVMGVPATGEFDAWCAIHAAQAISDRLAWQLPAERRASASPAGTVAVATGKALVRPQEGALPVITGPVFDRAMARLAAARLGEVSICEQTAAASRNLPVGNTSAGSTRSRSSGVSATCPSCSARGRSYIGSTARIG